ncbi:MAG: NADH-quinone oxidoreductase subunit A [Thermofilaceae archaeon]|nr:NADH-quinone oxidoreductase subunit A [Thermofilaceae archaeon]MCX8180722.1 NADH-quinone oxidoreductase subunit A [Thermofilaceae archaeon]MDW8003940.1 NADH-quinone oxidoreductase subunit A [Thermofilaceae archaeon]
MEEVADIVYLLISITLTIAGFYAFHKSTAPKTSSSSAKTSPYSCGEDLPPERIPVKVTLFKYVCLFVVIDVSVMLIAFSFNPLPDVYRSLIRGLLSAYCLTLFSVLVATVGWNAG